MSDFKEVIKENIKHFRTEMNINQEELSRLCGYSSTYIGKIERGQRSPSLDTLIRIAESLQIPLSALFDPFYKKQHQLKDSWDPNRFSPYDTTIRRFNYLVGFTGSEGELKQLIHLPWYNFQENYSDHLGKKLWELPFLNFPEKSLQHIKTAHKTACQGKPSHLGLTITGAGFTDQTTDLVFLPAAQDSDQKSDIRFELFYPRLVKKGNPVPLKDLFFKVLA
ncbi:MAG: helix-turn-helix domain-containing protein [bacterium]